MTNELTTALRERGKVLAWFLKEYKIGKTVVYETMRGDRRLPREDVIKAFVSEGFEDMLPEKYSFYVKAMKIKMAV